MLWPDGWALAASDRREVISSTKLATASPAPVVAVRSAVQRDSLRADAAAGPSAAWPSRNRSGANIVARRRDRQAFVYCRATAELAVRTMMPTAATICFWQRKAGGRCTHEARRAGKACLSCRPTPAATDCCCKPARPAAGRHRRRGHSQLHVRQGTVPASPA